MKMGEVIEGIREEVNPKKGLLRRFLDGLRGIAAPIAWRLWGRRRAIRRMRELAGVGTPPWRHPAPIDKEENRLRQHRENLDSIRVPLPTPDSHDVN